MKFNSKIFSFVTFCFLMSSVLWEGCQTQTPTSSSVMPPAVDQYTLANITSSKLSFNDNVIGNPGGIAEIVSYNTPITICNAPVSFQLVPNGYQWYNPQVNKPFTSVSVSCDYYSQTAYSYFFIPTGLADSYDQYAVSINGMFNDPENPNYPPGADNLDNVTFEILPGGGSAYDVTPYQGIEFYINVAVDDSVIDRQFLALVQEQLPTGGGFTGSCLSSSDPSLTHCYDGFLYDYANIPRNQWVLVQKNWGDLKQWGFGSITSPPTFSGTNLQQLAAFDWLELSTGAPGPQKIDYAIAGVRFY